MQKTETNTAKYVSRICFIYFTHFKSFFFILLLLLLSAFWAEPPDRLAEVFDTMRIKKRLLGTN